MGVSFIHFLPSAKVSCTNCSQSKRTDRPAITCSRGQIYVVDRTMPEAIDTKAQVSRAATLKGLFLCKTMHYDHTGVPA
jgi:hypothetical protein